MSECFICRRGGVGTPFAVIGVTYPEGSTCTCSDGTKTLTAKGTSGRAIFNIPYAATWTVSCTNGTDTASQDVSITAEGQSESVALLYELYLFDNGEQYTDTTGGWGSNSENKNNTKFEIGNTLRIYSTSDSGRALTTLCTANKLNLSAFETVKFDLESTHDASSGTPYFALSVIDDIPAYLSEPNYAAVNKITTLTRQTVSLDISSVSGEYRVALTGSAGSLKVYKIWAE